MIRRTTIIRLLACEIELILSTVGGIAGREGIYRVITHDQKCRLIRNGLAQTDNRSLRNSCLQQRHAIAAGLFALMSISLLTPPLAVADTETDHAHPTSVLFNADTINIYQESCSVCHGDDGQGAIWGQESLSTTPRDFTTQASRDELTRDRMIVSVTHGRPGTPMPGFESQLDATQIEAIVDYVRVRFMTARSEDVQIGNSVQTTLEYLERPLPGGLHGEFERGRSLYYMNCVACHGAAGDGDGPRAYFIFPKPRNFLDLATQQILNRPRLFSGISEGVIGKEMPAWNKVLENQDIADIAEFVYREFIRSDAD